MPEFAHDVACFQNVLTRISYEATRALERELDQCDGVVRGTMRSTLRQAVDAGAIAPHLANLLEFLQDRWKAHSPAVKLALLARLDVLSDGGVLPRQVLEEHPAIALLRQELAKEVTAGGRIGAACCPNLSPPVV